MKPTEAHQPKLIRRAKFASGLTLILMMSCLDGCKPSPSGQGVDKTPTPAIQARQVAAQGKLLPASGIISLSAMPGDQVSSMLVRSGQTVSQGDVLVVMRSNQLRQIELEAAQQKLLEARLQLKAKQSEVRLALQAADLRIEQSNLTQQQASKQLELVHQGKSQIELAGKQIDRLRRLRENEKTRDLVGQSDIDLKEMEFQRMQQLFSQNILAAQQAVQGSELAVKLAKDSRTAAEENVSIVNNSSSIESLEKQIELVKAQLEQTMIVAPSDATVLAVYASVGETAGPTPILEIGDLTSMVCVAEVHEVDVARLKVGDQTVITSAALPRELNGTVIQVNPLVGAPQLRLPNPLARTDYRSVPVRIKISPAQESIAAALVQLQVDVTITPQN